MAAATLDLTKKSVFNYHRVLLFNHDVQCKTPFASYSRSMFSDEDIDPAWFNGPLTPANRKKILSLRPLGGGRFSVFGKIELGTCAQRREYIEKDLNSLFQEFLDQEFPIEEGYGHMISARPSKVLSGWTYESKPKPLRSPRTAGEYRETDVPETEDEGSRSSDFSEFSKLLMEGQRIADSTKKSYFFEWRGYKACISSQLPKLSIHEVNRRFELAMQSIQKAKEQEQGPSVPLPDDEVVFKKPTTPSLASNSSSQSSGSQPESTSSQQSVSSLSLESEEPTQIPETQFDMDAHQSPLAPSSSLTVANKQSSKFVVEDEVSSPSILENRGEKEKPPRPEQEFNASEHVQVTLSGDTGSKANTVFARPQLEAAAYGPDGVLLKTSVCDEIEESVKKAAEIEKQLANSKKSYDTDDHKLEEEQDFMGLYESEINKQLHLRNRQRREWESMKKKQIADDENKKRQSSHQQKLLEQERREQDQIEMNETNVSKKLTASMVNACQEAEDDDDVLIKVVEVLRDQNANNITIKRNSKLCVQATKLQAERDKLFSDNQDKILSILHDLQGTMLRVASKLDMEKKVDIEAFFPIKNDSDMLRFLDKTDGQFKFRREEFENMLYCYVTKSIKLKRPFEATLLSTLFSRDYISSHRWPGASIEPADYDIVVPDEFTTILKVSLSKMVAAKCLNPELINLDFWRRIPNKFKGIRYYEDKKSKNREQTAAFAHVAREKILQPPLQATQAPQPPQARIKRLVKKGRKRTLAVNEVQPRKKQISDNVGESIQEEEEGVNNINDSGFQSTMGESIYEDFDN